MIVVLFSITMREGAPIEEEESASQRMWAIVSSMPGFISYKEYTAADGETIAVVRFESREALDAWKGEPRHRWVQEQGRESFYEQYWVQACEAFRSYRFTRASGYEEIPNEVFRAGARPLPGTTDTGPG